MLAASDAYLDRQGRVGLLWVEGVAVNSTEIVVVLGAEGDPWIVYGLFVNGEERWFGGLAWSPRRPPWRSTRWRLGSGG